MAAKASSVGSRSIGDRRLPPTSFVLETALLFIPVATTLAWYAADQAPALWAHRWELVAWTVALSLLNVLDVPAWRGQPLVADVPLLLGIAVVLPPGTAALVAFLGSTHASEFHDLHTLIRAINNRVTTAIGVFLAAVVAHYLESRTTWHIGLIVAVAWAIWTIENYLTVTAGICLLRKVSWRAALARLWPASPYDYALVVTAWIVLATLLGIWYDKFGVGALALLVLISLALRQTLVRSESTAQDRSALEQQARLVSALTARITRERQDERLRLASALHDEVIPSLFHLSLLAQVVKRDLQGDRLSEVSRDIEELVQAAEASTDGIREVIHGLRSSPVGMRGLAISLKQFGDEMRASCDAEIVLELDARLAELPASLELLVYQVAKEALTNSARHSRAPRISLSVRLEAQAVVLRVVDNGIGFDPSVAKDQHFGLLIMQERATTLGGSLDIDTKLGTGTVVTACFPFETATTADHPRNQARG